jgi:hypothetical protein
VSLRLVIDEEVAYEGEAIPIPRVGDHIHRGDEVFPIEAVTWDLANTDTIVVSLLVGAQPYTH